LEHFKANSAGVTAATHIVRSGGIIVYPTETVYGIGCLASDGSAIDKIASIKKSKPEASYLLLIESVPDLSHYCDNIPDTAWKLADAFWPGPLTLILPAKDGLHPHLVGASCGVAFRQSSHPWCGQLLECLEDALISTSANFSGDPPPKTLPEIDLNLLARIDAIIDGGSLMGVPSTVLDLCGSLPKILREGAVSSDNIWKILNRIPSK
jgi:L-threonylcarbamoyladenylate synthase